MYGGDGADAQGVALAAPYGRPLVERAALGRDLDAVTGMRAGELVAASFPRGVVRPLHGVGHYPWVDEPEMFRPMVEEFPRAVSV